MKIGIAAATLCLAIFRQTAAHADDDKFCEHHVIADDAKLDAPSLGGSIMRPPMVERCGWGRGFISPLPTVEYFSALHLTGSKFCKFISYDEKWRPTGRVFIRDADGGCPEQAYAAYTATSGLSDAEYEALLGFWQRLRAHPEFPTDPVFAHFGYSDPEGERAFLLEFQRELPRLSPRPLAMNNHSDAAPYRTTPAEKAAGIYEIEVDDGYELVLVAKGGDFEIIAVAQPVR